MSRPQAALETRELAVGYGPVAVVDGVSLQVGKGEAVALLGANGAGKSTLLKGLSGLLKPASGKVLFGGEETQGLAAETLVTRGMAHVAEGRRIFRRESVLDNLLLGMYRLKLSADERSARCEEVFALFPALKMKSGMLAGSLSGGQQQMLAIAQALVRKPSLVMLDEPSIGLAPILVEEVFRTLETVRAQGVAVLLVEQVVERTLQFVDYAYLLQNGRVSASGTPAQLAGSDVVQRAYLGEAVPIARVA
jgi:branched-chain amino acid transport system ATP-binding protein